MSERLTADISRDLRASAQDLRAEHRNTDAGLLTEAADKLDGLIALLAEAETDRDEWQRAADAAAAESGQMEAERDEARECAAQWMDEATHQAAERDKNYAEVQRLTANLASLGHWWCPNCEAIPPGVVDDDMCSRCSNQAEWSEPETLTSVKAYAEKVKTARDEAWADRDRLAAELAEVHSALTDGLTGYERDRLATPAAITAEIRALRAALLATTAASSRLAETIQGVWAWTADVQPPEEDVTDWQRGYRACSDRVREALTRADEIARGLDPIVTGTEAPGDAQTGQRDEDFAEIDTTSGRRGRLLDTTRSRQPSMDTYPLSEDWACGKCQGPLTLCVTCGGPAACGDSWCAGCAPGGLLGAEEAGDLAEIDTTEEEIDRQMAEAEPVEIVGPAQTFATSDPIIQTWPAGTETGDDRG